MMLEPWKAQVGTKPFRVTIMERPDRGWVCYLRWYVRGKPRYEKSAVGSVRDSRGRLMKRRVEEARAEGLRKADELAGIRPAPAVVKSGPMTLRRGVTLAFSDRGCYPLDPAVDGWTADARRYIEQLIPLVENDRAEGDDIQWGEVTPGMIRAVWRKVERKGGSADKAMKMLIVFFTIARWLEGEYQEERFPRPPKGWRDELKQHFHKQGKLSDPFRPPHTEEEIARLYRGVLEEKGDPRVRLAMTIGLELRGGQVRAAMRSHFVWKNGRWRVKIPGGSLKKRVPPLTLNRLEAAAWEDAIGTGYLSALEAAYQAGEITDYAIFPAGRLRKGKAVVERSQQPMDSLIGLFHDLERAVGVVPVKGRAWHGLRRGLANFYARMAKEGKIKDPRILDLLHGWVPGSTMRERIYQEQESEEMQDDSADARLLRPGTEAS